MPAGSLRSVFLCLAASLTVACSSDESTKRAAAASSPCEIQPPSSSAGILAVAAGRAPFSPLEVGNRWLYQRELWQQIVVDGQPPMPPNMATVMTERELIDTEEVAGMRYVVEEERTSGGALPGVEIRWWRHRQDDTGLYRRIMDPTDPPPSLVVAGPEALPEYLKAAWADHETRRREARAALDGTLGKLSEEVRRLAYPLDVGTMWMTSDDAAGVPATVEAMETLQLDIGRVGGWRIRIDPPSNTSEDSLYVWHGRCGVLQSLTHLVTHAMDPLTGQTATITSRQLSSLTELKLEDGVVAPASSLH